MLFDFKPTFTSGHLQSYISYYSRELIKSFFNQYKNHQEATLIENDEFSYLAIPYTNSDKTQKKLECIITHSDAAMGIFKHKDFNTVRYVNTYAEDNLGIAICTNGAYTYEFFEGIKSIAPDLYSGFKEAYVNAVQSDKKAIDLAQQTDGYIHYLTQWALSENQLATKKGNDNYIIGKKIKAFNDLDYSCYFVEPNIMNVICHASFMLYSCVFDINGYKVYGQAKDYGFIQEHLVDEHFNSEHETGFDRLFLKHALQDENLILSSQNGNIVPYDHMLKSFSSIAAYIKKCTLKDTKN